jgi:hypothetical protein
MLRIKVTRLTTLPKGGRLLSVKQSRELMNREQMLCEIVKQIRNRGGRSKPKPPTQWYDPSD